MGIALLVVASLVGLLASPASAATGTLSGTVSDSSAAPIGGATVDVFEATWGIPAGSTTTQPDGTYSLAVAPGTYRVRFTHPTHAETWSGSATSWVTSSAITIDDGATTVADATMADLDTIEGTVTDPDNNPVAGLTVELLYMGLAYRTTPTAADGTYQFTDVPNATFTLGFRDPTGTTWAMEYSGGSNTETGATRITTTGGTTHTIDHTVHHGGSISGTNGIGDTGPGVAGLYVVALDVDHLEIVGAAATDTNGAWQIDNLPPGDVTIATIDPAALSATSYNSYRLVFRPERDVDTLGLANAWTTATHYPITTGTTTPTGRQPLRGRHCNPTTHHPGANLDGSHLTNKDLRGCNIAGSQLTTQRASGDYVWFCESVFPPPSIGGEFAYANFSGLDLSHLSLSGDFTGANLTGVDLSVSVVPSWADFTGARIAGADLSETLIDPAKILATDRDWTGTKLSTLRDANDPLCMWWTQFDSIDWSGGGWSLAEADLSGISLTNGNFAGMDLHGLRLSASPSGDWGDVAEIDGSTFAGSDLSNAKLMALDFQGVSTDGAILTGADLTNAKNIARRYFAGADLRGTNLTNVALGSANLTNADLTGANLTGTNLYGAGLNGAVLTGVTYERTVLTNTYLRNRNFSGLSLRSVTFSGADLKNARFANADLTSAKFPGANLNGVTFAGANLTNADLTGATGNPSGGTTAVYANTTCPDGTTASPATAQTTCVGHGVGA
ncbi:MAG: pentapeptide repeat-containing protein [Acidimicrobiales bacterium]|nr:pentapeptide repeat-containing protein [Acidimicrobiales bacterium]